MSQGPRLRRSLSLVHITLYGLGTTIGAGIYALIGKVAGTAGMYTPISFLLAAILAGFSALSFAELSSRYPRAAGEAVYVREGFGSDRLALVIGIMVVLTAMISSAAIINGFVGYLHEFVDAPRSVAITGLVLVLTGLAIWGIGQSVAAAALITLLEIGGLLLVIWVGRHGLADLPLRAGAFVPPIDAAAWAGIFAGTFLAFYAFIGFEDMVNVAEEVKDASRAMPLAIVITLVLTLLLYLAVAATAVLTVAPATLAASEAPLALVYARAAQASSAPISTISVFAIVNGALIQIILAARVLYGLAGQGALPSLLGRVHAVTQTPVIATIVVAVCILVLALWFRLGPLAKTTSIMALIVFTMVNLSLWRVKRRDPDPPGVAVYPAWIPVAGTLVSIGFLAIEAVRQLTDG